jgi:hypothetical protein
MSATRLLRLLAILMLLLAPIRVMAEGAAAGNTHTIMVAFDLGHCGGSDSSQKGQSRTHTHCSMAAPGVPASGEHVDARIDPAAADQPWSIFLEPHGLSPETTTPPPRRS